MNDINLKYGLLDDSSKKKVLDLIQKLQKAKKATDNTSSSYREKILQVSNWSEADIADLKDKHSFNQWNLAEW